MTKLHIVYDTLAQVRYPNRMTDQFALCGVYTPTGEQICLDSPRWLSSPGICQRCRRKAETLTVVAGDTLTVKPGMVVPQVGRRKVGSDGA